MSSGYCKIYKATITFLCMCMQCYTSLAMSCAYLQVECMHLKINIYIYSKELIFFDFLIIQRIDSENCVKETVGISFHPNVAFSILIHYLLHIHYNNYLVLGQNKNASKSLIMRECGNKLKWTWRLYMVYQKIKKNTNDCKMTIVLLI